MIQPAKYAVCELCEKKHALSLGIMEAAEETIQSFLAANKLEAYQSYFVDAIGVGFGSEFQGLSSSTWSDIKTHLKEGRFNHVNRALAAEETIQSFLAANKLEAYQSYFVDAIGVSFGSEFQGLSSSTWSDIKTPLQEGRFNHLNRALVLIVAVLGAFLIVSTLRIYFGAITVLLGCSPPKLRPAFSRMKHPSLHAELVGGLPTQILDGYQSPTITVDRSKLRGLGMNSENVINDVPFLTKYSLGRFMVLHSYY